MTATIVRVVKGLCAEFIDRLQRQGDASRYVFDPKCSSAVSLNSHAWKVLAMELCQEAGVKLMLQTLIVDTLRTGDRIHGVVVEDKSGRQKIEASVVIDCTGDGTSPRGEVPTGKEGRTKDGMVQALTWYFAWVELIVRASSAACQSKEFGYQ